MTIFKKLKKCNCCGLEIPVTHKVCQACRDLARKQSENKINTLIISELTRRQKNN